MSNVRTIWATLQPGFFFLGVLSSCTSSMECLVATNTGQILCGSPKTPEPDQIWSLLHQIADPKNAPLIQSGE
jgi:hypothetical protein